LLLEVLQNFRVGDHVRRRTDTKARSGQPQKRAASHFLAKNRTSMKGDACFEEREYYMAPPIQEREGADAIARQARRDFFPMVVSDCS
jgi:hypothetical protein